MIKIANNLYLLVAALIGTFVSYGCKSQTSTTEKKLFISKQEAERVVNQLSELGYYKYANPGDVDSLKADLVSSISAYGVLSTLFPDRPTSLDQPIISKDYRYYLFDGETIFEKGGFTSTLKEMQAFFDKIDLKLDITNHIEEINPATRGLNHELTVNGKQYIIFHELTRGYAWDDAAKKYAEMINDQLEMQNKNERLYLISGGNDGAAVFLTDELFQFINKLLVDEQWKPLPVSRWYKMVGGKE